MADQDHHYRGMDVGEGQWIIYENDNPKAWLQSDYYMPLQPNESDSKNNTKL